MGIKRANVSGWLADVKPSNATSAPPGTFGKDAAAIARIVASKHVSPKGIGSAIRMVQFYLNRSGSGISAARRREIERAKRLLQERLRREAKR
ncbi:MAG: DUF3175 domain-containing protein [Candidatus Binatia bacterium]